MNREVIVFTMKGCPHCSDFKEMLKNENISFHEYDIHEHDEEYNNFAKAVDNEFIPAFIIFEQADGGEDKLTLFAPERDFNTLEEGVNKIKSLIN